jgi:hypothetical protein
MSANRSSRGRIFAKPEGGTVNAALALAHVPVIGRRREEWVPTTTAFCRDNSGNSDRVTITLILKIQANKPFNYAGLQGVSAPLLFVASSRFAGRTHPKRFIVR